jgi:hypothetical protein
VIGPDRATEKEIRGLISFHESAAEWYAQHDQPTLEIWARTRAAAWREKLQALKWKQTTGEGSIQ